MRIWWLAQHSQASPQCSHSGPRGKVKVCVEIFQPISFRRPEDTIVMLSGNGPGTGLGLHCEQILTTIL